MRALSRWGCALALLACADGPSPSAEGRSLALPTVATPNVMFAGCQDIVAGACLLPKDGVTLAVWLDVNPQTRLRVSIDGDVVEPDAASIDGGLRLTVAVPAGSRAIEIAGTEPVWSEPWRLAAQDEGSPAVIAEATAIYRADNDLERAMEIVEAALPSLTGAERLAASRWLSLAEYSRGGEHLEERYQQVIALADALGHPNVEAEAIASLIYIALREGRTAPVAGWLARLDALGEVSFEAKVHADRQRGRLALEEGDVSLAIRASERAVQLAERLDKVGDAVAALTDLINAHAEMADWPRMLAAADRLQALIGRPGLKCNNRLGGLISLAWGQLLAQRAGVADAWPIPALDEALALAGEDGACPSAEDEANIRTNFALHWLQQGDAALGLAWLEPLDIVPPAVAPWVEEVRARAGLALGRRDLIPTPLSIPNDERPDDRWNAWVRHARVLESIGAPAAAADAWAEAEALVDERAMTLDMGGGAERYAEGRSASARGLVTALVGLGRPDQALCRARMARGRLLRVLDHRAALSRVDEQTRERWRQGRRAYLQARQRLVTDAGADREFSATERARRVARRADRERQAREALEDLVRPLTRGSTVAVCEDLPALETGTTQIVLFPATRGWWVFVADRAGLDVAWRSSLAAGEARTLLSGFEGRIRDATRIRVILTGEAWDVVVPSLVVDGRGTLLEQAPIVYALDLRRTPTASTKRAVVVADPSGNLQQALAESETVRALLSSAGWTVRTLTGAQATRAGLIDAVAEAGVLHYAGHGRARGDAGWASALVLHQGEALDVVDVLAMRAVPGTVVLTGCETGAADSASVGGGMSLGRAFVLAGADAVLATRVRVDDRLARTVGEQVYEGLGDPQWDLAVGTRNVQLRLRRSQPESDWAAFRVIVP